MLRVRPSNRRTYVKSIGHGVKQTNAQYNRCPDAEVGQSFTSPRSQTGARANSFHLSADLCRLRATLTLRPVRTFLSGLPEDSGTNLGAVLSSVWNSIRNGNLEPSSLRRLSRWNTLFRPGPFNGLLSRLSQGGPPSFQVWGPDLSCQAPGTNVNCTGKASCPVAQN